jgi:uncharacterized protein with PIN domain
MIVVDSSALVAILEKETDASRYADVSKPTVSLYRR